MKQIKKRISIALIWCLSSTFLLSGCGAEKQKQGVEQTCYMTISCETILKNMEDLKAGKETVVPENGILMEREEVTFYEGESVFDILQRETKEHKIQLEYEFTPGFDSNYIEGIGNLYEFDCGKNSGWMYSVNGEFPNVGCSGYEVKAGDEIRWDYSCDLGRDLENEM